MQAKRREALTRNRELHFFTERQVGDAAGIEVWRSLRSP